MTSMTGCRLEAASAIGWLGASPALRNLLKEAAALHLHYKHVSSSMLRGEADITQVSGVGGFFRVYREQHPGCCTLPSAQQQSIPLLRSLGSTTYLLYYLCWSAARDPTTATGQSRRSHRHCAHDPASFASIHVSNNTK